MTKNDFWDKIGDQLVDAARKSMKKQDINNKNKKALRFVMSLTRQIEELDPAAGMCHIEMTQYDLSITPVNSMIKKADPEKIYLVAYTAKRLKLGLTNREYSNLRALIVKNLDF